MIPEQQEQQEEEEEQDEEEYSSTRKFDYSMVKHIIRYQMF